MVAGCRLDGSSTVLDAVETTLESRPPFAALAASSAGTGAGAGASCVQSHAAVELPRYNETLWLPLRALLPPDPVVAVALRLLKGVATVVVVWQSVARVFGDITGTTVGINAAALPSTPAALTGP